jgi:uncharacterized RDD family membrane protein YckC
MSRTAVPVPDVVGDTVGAMVALVSVSAVVARLATAPAAAGGRAPGGRGRCGPHARASRGARRLGPVADRLLPRAAAAVLSRLDVASLVDRYVDVDRIAGRLDIDAVAARLDVDPVVDRVDVDAIAAGLDLNTLVEKVPRRRPGGRAMTRTEQRPGRRAPAGRALPLARRPRPGAGRAVGAGDAVDVALVLLALTLGYAGWAGFRLLLDPAAFRLTAPEYEWVVLAVGAGLVLYWTVTWAGPGRTHGDQFMGLRVVTRRGARLHPLHAAARAVLCVLFLPGLFWVLVSRRNRLVQDVVLCTAVVYD